MVTQDKCCELVDGKKWQKKTIQWKDKPFVKGNYLAFFYMPLTANGKIQKIMNDLLARKMIPDDGMLLWRNEGLFGGEFLVTLKKDVPDMNTEKISGKFFTMYFEGKGYQDAGKWHKAFDEEAKKKGLDVKEKMTWYTLCPGCLKKFGKMQGVIFGRV